MDLLSLTASIIAVVNAGGALANGLKKLYGLKEAREEVRDLGNEVSRFEKTLHQTAVAYQAPHSRIANSLEGGLVESLTKGKNTALELDFLIKYVLLKPPDKNGKVVVDRFVWVREKKTVQRLKQTLRDVRSDIADMIRALLLCSSQSQELQLHEFHKVFKSFLQSVERSCQELQKQGLSIDKVQQEMKELRACMRPPTSISPTLQIQDASPLRRRKVRAIMPEPGILFQPSVPIRISTGYQQGRAGCEPVMPVSPAMDYSEVPTCIPQVKNSQLDDPTKSRGITTRSAPEPIKTEINLHRMREDESDGFYGAFKNLEDRSVLVSPQQDAEQSTRIETQRLPRPQESSSTSFENESLGVLCGKVRLRPTHKEDPIFCSHTELSTFASIDAILARSDFNTFKNSSQCVV